VDVPLKYLGIHGHRDDTLLDPRATTIVQPDDRATDVEGDVHEPAYLLSVHLAQTAAEDGEILREHAYGPPAYRSDSGNDATGVAAIRTICPIYRFCCDSEP
jgi:hypothetical protein